MSKTMRMVLVVLIALALLVAWKFGRLGAEQMIYLGRMTAGWLAWTVAVATVYRVLEKLIPRVLCPLPTEEAPARTDGLHGARPAFVLAPVPSPDERKRGPA